jgi:hypothetical protein
MKTTTIYACYLPGSSTPDYIGSHSAQPANSGAARWRYEHCTYLGQGCWIDKEGIIIAMPRNNRNTEWGKLLLLMSAAERLAIRIEILDSVDTADRWKAEAQALRTHTPRFNRLIPSSPDDKRLKYNAYQRAYQRAYLARNPDKLEAKRARDRERIAAKRAAAKRANEPINVA